MQLRTDKNCQVLFLILKQFADCRKQNSGCNGGLFVYVLNLYESSVIASGPADLYTVADCIGNTFIIAAKPQEYVMKDSGNLEQL